MTAKDFKTEAVAQEADQESVGYRFAVLQPLHLVGNIETVRSPQAMR